MARLLTNAFVSICLLVISVPAFAETAADEYASTTQKKMLLSAKESKLAAHERAALMEGLKLKNFEIQRWKVTGSELQAWCDKASEDTQMSKGAVDAKGQARMTIEGVERRCSDVFEYDMNVSKSCKQSGTKFECKASLTMTVYRYNAAVSESTKDPRGYTIDFTRNGDFGKGGKFVVKSSGTAKMGNKKAALAKALKSAGEFGRRGLLEIRAFQVHAPVQAVKGSDVFLCLGNDLVDLDLPFRVVYQTSEGEEDSGFIKAREIFDGCVETKTLKARKEAGKAVTLKPLRAETIYGDIKPGHTAWELPQIGLNIGLGAAITSLVDGQAFMANIVTEKSLARSTGISELHLMTHIRAGLMTHDEGIELVRSNFAGAYPSLADALTDFPAVPVAQIDLGALKRFYMGRLFFEVGAGASVSWYHLGQIDDPTTIGKKLLLGLAGVGGVGKGGIGMQITPRLATRIDVGYRYAMTLAMILNEEFQPMTTNNGIPIPPPTASAPDPLTESGLVTHFDILYLY